MIVMTESKTSALSMRSRSQRGLVNCKASVRLERVPHPYRAVLAICSDLDETRNPFVYFETLRFLNTDEETSLGRGVGLEVGNSLYFAMPAGAFSYWNCDEVDREALRDLIRSGHIDCFHSFGDTAVSRHHALRSLDDLNQHQCRLTTWVDHAKAPTNFGEDIMQGQGDVVDSPCYHADATVAYGVKYVWRGRVTSVIGQDCPRSIRGLFNSRHPAKSVGTMATEFAKSQAVGFGQRKYDMHVSNRLVRPARLRDGQVIHEFLRFDPYWGGVGRAATADGLPEILTDKMLDTLVGRSGIGVFYTHLGRTKQPSGLMTQAACDAFRALANRFKSRDVLVLTTTRLLDYVTMRDYLQWDAWNSGQGTIIQIDAINDPVSGRRIPKPCELGGLTFSTAEANSIRIELGEGRAVDAKEIRQDGRSFVSVPFSTLPFPVLSKRHTCSGAKT